MRRSGARRRHLWLALALTGFVIAGCAGSSRGPAASIPLRAIAIHVAATPTGPAVPSGFLGLSLEYSSLLPYAGTDPAALDPALVRLLLDLNGDGPPPIRFGGDSTDWTWWPIPGESRPTGIRYQLTPRWLAVARALTRATGSRLLLGINLEADSSLLASVEARELLAGLGAHAIQAFEVGNEPEVYGTIGWYTRPDGVPVPGRPATYDFGSSRHDYALIGSALPSAVPLAGPASGAPVWIRGAARFLAADSRTGLLTYHFYPLRRCYTSSSSPVSPTIGHLLSAQAAALPTDIAHAARVAHADGRTLRLDELNSVSCKGQPGVSDTFASALWVLEALFHIARGGVDGVNVHTLAGADYAPFVFTRAGGRWQARVNPLYYGLLTFTLAAPAGARFLHTSHRAAAGLQTWATVSPGGVVHVMLINDSPTATRQLVVSPAGDPASAARLVRLVAPSLAAKSGVSLDGQSFGSLGQLVGAPATQTLAPVNGRYVVALPPASAALLTWR